MHPGYHGEAECCANCRHYHQHYIYCAECNGFTYCFDGHCVYPRMKHRRPDQLCEHFERTARKEVQVIRWADGLQKM